MSERYAYDWLVRKGYLPHQAAGVVGNLVQESGVRPAGVVGDNGTAFGIAQWRGPRFQALQNFAQHRGGNWQDLDTQLSFLDHELNTTERRAGDMLRSAGDVRGATRAMMAFERPQGFTFDNPEAGHGWQNRLAAASRLAGLPAPPAGAPATAQRGPVLAASFGPVPPAAAPIALDPTPGLLAQAFVDQDQEELRKKVEADATAARRKALFGDVGSMFA